MKRIALLLWRNPRFGGVVLVATLGFALAVHALFPSPEGGGLFRSDSSLPDFSSIAGRDERKAAFIDYLLPFVIAANQEIALNREKLLQLRERFDQAGTLSAGSERFVREIQAAYGLDADKPIDRAAFDTLLSRVDQIPPSVALAQAALESAWGSSRFAKEGNNLFGTRCFKPGCGIVPYGRSKRARHEYATYASPRESFAFYIRNLNTHFAHASLRVIRRAQRENGVDLDGHALAAGLTRYSQDGARYVRRVQSLIQSENLERYDAALSESLASL